MGGWGGRRFWLKINSCHDIVNVLSELRVYIPMDVSQWYFFILLITRNQKLSYHKLCYTMPMALRHRLMSLISGKLSRFLYANSSEDRLAVNLMAMPFNVVHMPMKLELGCQCHLKKLPLEKLIPI